MSFGEKYLNGDGSCWQLPEHDVLLQMESDEKFKEQSENLAKRYADSSMRAVANLSSMLLERAPSEGRKRKENGLMNVLSTSNAVSSKYLKTKEGQGIADALEKKEMEELAQEDDADGDDVSGEDEDGI